MMLNIVICGIGGQGNILSSGLVGAALMEKGFKVAVGETYGASQRGGSVMSHLRVSDQTETGVLIPKGRADVVIGFEPVEALRILRVYGNPETVVIYDPRPAYPLGVLIGEDIYPSAEAIDAEIKSRSREAFIIPGTEIAMNAGNSKVANIVMMGALTALSEMPLTPQEFFDSLSQNFSGATLELNKQVFRLGYDALLERRGK